MTFFAFWWQLELTHINFYLVKYMASGGIHIAWGDTALVQLTDIILRCSTPTIPVIHRTLESFLLALDTDKDAGGIYICPPNWQDSNDWKLAEFLKETGEYLERIQLILDQCDLPYWKSHWWEGKTHTYNVWVWMFLAVQGASIRILDSKTAV